VEAEVRLKNAVVNKAINHQVLHWHTLDEVPVEKKENDELD
jgi:hypothetical protein